jgi:O-methyltransferase
MHNYQDRYLDLLADALSFSLWSEPIRPVSTMARRGLAARAVRLADRLLKPTGLTLGIAPKNKSGDGTFWPALAHTMVGRARLDNIRVLCSTVELCHVPGSFVECGVWRGGASIYARACLPVEREVFCCDSFRGMPYDQTEAEYAGFDMLRVSREEVEENFRRYGLYHNVNFIEGYFKDTLKALPGPIAVLRADGDMFSSTMTILVDLYDKVSAGGYIIIDDYILPPCRKAVDQFRAFRNIHGSLVTIDTHGVYWRK